MYAILIASHLSSMTFFGEGLRVVYIAWLDLLLPVNHWNTTEATHTYLHNLVSFGPRLYVYVALQVFKKV